MMHDDTDEAVAGCAVAVGAILAAVLGRFLLDPFLGDHLPFVTFFVAVAIAAWYGGLWPGVVATVLGMILSRYFFVPPRFSLGGTMTGPNLVGLATYVMVTVAITAFGEAMWVARRRSLRAEHTASNQEEWLRTTLASIGDAVIATDADGKVIFLNEVAQRLTGWKQDESRGLPLQTVFNIINEKTRQPVDNPVSKVLRDGVTVGLANHTLLVAKDGKETPIDDSAAPIRSSKGDIGGVVLVFRDITERRRLEREAAERAAAARLLAAVVESSDDAIVSKSLDGIIQTWNSGAERLFGHTAQEAIGRHITLIIPADRAAEEDAIITRIRAGRVDHFDTVRVRKDGRLINVSLTISPVKDEEGRIVGASKIARDITERKQNEQFLKESERRKDEFLATLAHELRNPLAPIRNALELLRRAGDDRNIIERTRPMMERQVGQMARLIDDLLDVARISRGKIELRREQVELSAVVMSAVELTRPLVEELEHELTVAIPTEPIHLDADPTRLTQIFSNLINNAAKYTERGGRIWLTAERRDDEAVVIVRDMGIGIAPEHLPRLFEMFSQVAPALERSQGGLGVGLSLVRSLVELHGGSVEARSGGLGKGSEFIVRLPHGKTAAQLGASNRRDSKPAAELADQPQNGAKRRILIVDDNRDAADSLAMMLKMMGHEIRTAYDGLDAVGVAESFQPDVLFLDIGLPRMNGYEAAMHIREQPWGKDVVLVALTGWGQEEDKRRAVAAGYDHHLTKPVDPAAMERLLEKLIAP